MKISKFIVVFAFLLAACENTNKAKIIKLGHGLDIKHPVHLALLQMGKDIDSLSKGTLKLDIYPNQQLGTERECLELLQIGSMDITKVSVGVLENFAPKMKLLGLPFLFQDRQHSFEVLDGPIGKTLLQDAEKYWLKGLGFYDAGSRSFYSKNKPINIPSDLKGQKIRVMESATAIDMVQTMGGSPTPISWGELYTSLQQGVVDGAENNPPSFYLSRHYEVCKYYTLSEHTTIPDVLVAGTSFWNRLSQKEKKWLQEAVKESIRYQRVLWAKAESEALEAVKKAGVEVIVPNRQSFRETVQTMYEAYKDNKELYGLLLDIKKLEKPGK